MSGATVAAGVAGGLEALGGTALATEAVGTGAEAYTAFAAADAAATAGSTLSTIATGVQVAGGLASVAGAVSGGYSQQAMSQYQAQVARNNATIATQNANYEQEAGNAAIQKSMLRGAAAEADMKAKQGASGFDVNSGSNVDMQSSEAELSKLDQLGIQSNTDMQVRNSLISAGNYASDASMDQDAGDQDVLAGYLKGAGSLASTASTINSKWANWLS